MTLELSPDFYKAFKPDKIRNAAQCADEKFFLPAGDSHAGRWRSRRYQVELLKAMSLGSRLYANGAPINEIVLMKSAQVGYTSCLLNSIFYHVIYKPTKIALYFPNDNGAKQFAKNELADYIKAQPALEGIVDFASTVDGKSRYDSKKFPGGEFRMLAANKSADLASSTYRLIYCDELDMFPNKVGKEGDPLRLIKDRAKEYTDALLVYGGTPRGNFQESKTWKMYHQSDMRRYFVPCPKCGKMQYLAWPQFEVDKSDWNKSGFRCIDEKCNFLMLENDKLKMIEQGEWRPTNDGSKDGSIVIPGRAGFNIWAAYSDTPTAAWPLLARTREACKHNGEEFRAFLNTTVGIPTHSGDPTAIRAVNIVDNDNVKASTYETIEGAEGVPDEVDLITCGVDVQTSKANGRLEFSLFGWSRKKCYFLNHAKIYGDFRENSVWEALEAVVSTKFLTKDKKKLIPVSRAMIDSGDGNATHTVMTRCRKNNVFYPIKGFPDTKKPLIHYSKTLHTKQWLFHANTVVAKDKINELLREWCSGNPDSELKLPSDLSIEIAQAYTSEYRTTGGGNPPKVMWIHNGAYPNEALDCFVYALCAKESLIGLRDPQKQWQRYERQSLINKKKINTGNFDFVYPQVEGV